MLVEDEISGNDNELKVGSSNMAGNVQGSEENNEKVAHVAEGHVHYIMHLRTAEATITARENPADLMPSQCHRSMHSSKKTPRLSISHARWGIPSCERQRPHVKRNHATILVHRRSIAQLKEITAEML